MVAQNRCKKQYAVRFHFFYISRFFIRSSKSSAKPLQKTAHRATTLVVRATQRFYSPQPPLQNYLGVQGSVRGNLGVLESPESLGVPGNRRPTQ